MPDIIDSFIKEDSSKTKSGNNKDTSNPNIERPYDNGSKSITYFTTENLESLQATVLPTEHLWFSETM